MHKLQVPNLWLHLQHGQPDAQQWAQYAAPQHQQQQYQEQPDYSYYYQQQQHAPAAQPGTAGQYQPPQGLSQPYSPQADPASLSLLPYLSSKPCGIGG